MAAGTAMPPTAATAGRAALRQVESSPATSSRLISSPTTRKNRVMRPSLTQWGRAGLEAKGAARDRRGVPQGGGGGAPPGGVPPHRGAPRRRHQHDPAG